MYDYQWDELKTLPVNTELQGVWFDCYCGEHKERITIVENGFKYYRGGQERIHTWNDINKKGYWEFFRITKKYEIKKDL